MRVTPFADPKMRFLAGKFGVGLFLVSLGMLFAATLVGFLVIRVQLGVKDLWPTDLPPLPRALWLSTAVIILSSITMQRALQSARAGATGPLRTNLLFTTMLGLVFMLVQCGCWFTWAEPILQRWMGSEEFRFALTSFYVLTGLHGLHVIGGLLPLAMVTRNAFLDMYSAEHYSGVQFCAMYWHFLGAVWIILFITLILGR